MNRTVSRTGATIYKGVAIAWLTAVALWVLWDNGLEGLLGTALLFLVAFISLHLGRRETPRREAEFEPPRFGPTDDERYYDFAYKNIYPENIFSDRK